MARPPAAVEAAAETAVDDGEAVSERIAAAPSNVDGGHRRSGDTPAADETGTDTATADVEAEADTADDIGGIDMLTWTAEC